MVALLASSRPAQLARMQAAIGKLCAMARMRAGADQPAIDAAELEAMAMVLEAMRTRRLVEREEAIDGAVLPEVSDELTLLWGLYAALAEQEPKLARAWFGKVDQADMVGSAAPQIRPTAWDDAIQESLERAATWLRRLRWRSRTAFTEET